MKIKSILTAVLLLLLLKCSDSQIIPFTYNLDTSITKTLDSALIYVKNPSAVLMNITNVRVLTTQFLTRVNSFTVAPHDSVGVWVIFSSYQNLTYTGFIAFENTSAFGGIRYSIVYGLKATAKYPDAIYAFTQGLIDENLKAALKTYTSTGAIVLGYNTARDKMFETVDDYGGDTIECVYTGRKIHAVNRTEAQNQNFNTEHTWPQSFFNSNDPMVSDLHHLFPTDETPNSQRSNYPFGFVVSGITWQLNGSKLGRDQYNSIVFEPRDQHKGNAARALFYFVVRHQNWGNFLTLNQETALRQFHVIDTVDARERLRNDRVKTFQNNRNPFCDHPEFVERIRAFYTTAATLQRARISASPLTVRFDTLSNVNDTASYYLSIFNNGNAALTVNSLVSSNPVFTVESAPSNIPPSQYGLAKIKFRPDVANTTFNGTLTINNSDSNIVINLTGINGTPIGITPISSEVPKHFSLSQNYPNPFNPTTKIRFDIPAAVGNAYMSVQLKIYDVAGREVMTLVNEQLHPGKYEVGFNGDKLSSGIYYYRVQADDFTDVKKMVLLK